MTILVPYYITEKTLPIGCTIWTLWIFMESSGKSLWTTEDGRDTLIREYLNENGIFGEEQPSVEPFLLYKVDTEKTQMKDFHTWSDILAHQDTKPEHVWRPFFWIGDSMYGKVDPWGWTEEVGALKLDTFHTMGQVWQLIASASGQDAGLSGEV
jgi:hypothetical protein